MSTTAEITQGIQDFWAGLGIAAPYEWPESIWPDRWVWTEEMGGTARSGEMPCGVREEKYRCAFRVRSTGEGWTQMGWAEALQLRDRAIELLESPGQITFGGSADGIDLVEYSKVTPARVTTPVGDVLYWVWTIDLTVVSSH